MRSYGAYRASGLDWIGSFPAHWSLQRVGNVFRQRSQIVSDADFAPLSVTNGGIVPQLEDVAKTAHNDTRKLVIAGDFVINSRSDRKGAAGIAMTDGSVSVISIVLQPLVDFDLRYAHHLLRSRAFQEEFYRWGNGIVADLWSTRYTSLKSIQLPWPELEEQREISSYLDRETARIDGLVGEQVNLLTLLAERRTSVVTRLISGQTESVTRLKRVSSTQTGLTLGKEPNDGEEVPYLRVANVQAGSVTLDEVKTVRVSPAELLRHSLSAGDVLMTEGGDIDKLGRGAVWEGALDPCVHQNHVFAVRCAAELDRRFLTYWMDAQPARRYFRDHAKKTTNLAAINSTILGNLPIELPDLEVQKRIVVDLDNETRRIDLLTDECRALVTLLKERRAALITAAVTGQIDVRSEVDTPDDEATYRINSAP